MRNLAFHTLTDRIADDGRVTAEEALDLRRTVFPDGVVSRLEAEALITLDARVNNPGPEWSAAFAEAIADHLLGAGPNLGHVTEGDAAWLEAQFGAKGARETEVEALLKVLERAESAPERVLAFARTRLAAALAGKPIGAAEVQLIRRCLFAVAGSGAISVTEAEAQWMFALDAESDGRTNDPAWADVFVKAILNHLMARRAPELLNAQGQMDRQRWLANDDAHTPQALAAQAARGAVSIFRGGVRSVAEALNVRSNAEVMEDYYEAANDSAAADERLTLEEIAWTVGMSRQDGKRTANEAKLLDELRRIQAAQN